MDSGKKPPRFPWHLLVVFALLAAGIVAVGYVYYHGYEQHYRTEAEHKLLAIAELKTDELTGWRRERMGGAAAFFKNAAFSALVRRHFSNPDDAEAQSQLRSWLGQSQAGFSYGRVFLLDARSVSRMQVPDAPEPVAAHLSQDAAETLRCGKITFLDFHRDAPDGPVYLAILVPIFDEEDGNRPLGVLALRIDPTTYLYPFISRWPTPSLTAETLLVRRDDDDAMFLNDLRFQKNTALMLRVPLTKKEQPAVMAALGQEGIVEGKDYRGVAVIAAVRAVPDSPWFMVARIDASEVYAPAKERLWIVIVLVGALLLGAGAALGVVWRHQSVLFYKEKFEAVEALRVSEEKYRTLFQTMAQGVIHQSADGKILSANPAAERILGLTLDEMQGRTSIDPRWRAIHEDGSDFPGQTHPAMVALQTGREVRDVVMGVYNPRTKSHVWINVNAVPRIEPGDDKPCQVYATFDDITERKRAEKQLAGYQRRLRSLGARLALAEENERRRIAADLHDDVVQALALAKIKLQSLRAAHPDTAPATMEEIESMVGHAVLSTRSLLFDLSPPPLYELGLEAAVEWLAEKTQTEHKLPVAVEDDRQAKPLSEETRGILFRAVRELLHNTVKHAHARQVRVAISRENPHIRVEVADDGTGFTPDKSHPHYDASGGFGLFHIREFLDYVGGSMKIHSEPGCGTRVILLAPLQKEPPKT
jgi:PAS domain S-box-containing protein